MTVRSRRRCLAMPGLLIAAALVVVAGTRALAAGPLIVNGAGEPLVWDPMDVPWNPDLGGLGAFDNVAAVQLVAASFDVWAAVPTASITFANAGSLGVDVTASNARSFIGVCGDGLSPIIFDDDGSLTDFLLGNGASNAVLGFAGPECGTFTPPRITEASAVLNGKFIDGVIGAANPEIPLADFSAVFVHEFGHYVNLDHTQINLIEAFNANRSDDAAVATMFPILVSGTEELSLERDDEVALSMLYPAPALEGFGRITGQVLASDGVTPFQGAFVIARNTADPRRDAIGYVSGARYFPSALGGPPDPSLRGAYELAGLTPGADYTVEVEPVYPGFIGGSSVGPFNVPRQLPGPPEFWSGTNEAATAPPDDPVAPGVPLTTTAGVTIPDVDIILNLAAPPANDACEAAIAIDPLPFDTILLTDLASRAASDPLQACTRSGAARNGNSVWYTLLAPANGTVAVSTAGSAYDTVLSAYTGRCGTLGAVACNDDRGDAASEVTFPVSAGTRYLIEVAAFGETGGGKLILSARFDADGRATCTAAAPGTCIPGGGGHRTDCGVEWLLEPVPAVAGSRGASYVPNAHVDCTDGDPSCDFDGAADGRCRFHVALCVNNHDPRPAASGCVPSGIGAYELLLPRTRRARDADDEQNAASVLSLVTGLAGPSASLLGAAAQIAPPLTDPDRCSPYGSVTVPIGTRIFRSKARTSTGKTDVDKLRLRCRR